MALSMFNRKIGGVNGVELQKNSGVNVAQPEKKALKALNLKKLMLVALTAFNRKKSGVNDVEPEKQWR